MDIAAFITNARTTSRATLDEFTGKKILSAFGVSVPKGRMVSDDSELEKALADLTPPFAVKAVSADIIHKSDVGAVTIGLGDKQAVGKAIADMRSRLSGDANIDGFIVEEMATPGHELVLGAVQDPQFGSLVMIGLGGVFVEIFEDVAFRIFPLTRADAHDMLDDLKAAPILAGARGGAAINKEVLVDAILKFGGADGLLAKHGDAFAEIDINPLIVSLDAAVAVDARFVLAAT
jgi:acetate---CoA ligase (ADP-forming) subunit beta